MYLSGNSNLSSLVLNLNTVSLHTMSSLKVFHLLIQRTGKLFNLSVFSHLGLTILNKCHLVQLSLNSKKLSDVMSSLYSYPCTISNNCIKSYLFLL